MGQLSIFISHSHQDNEWCRSLAAALKAVGYDVWYDETGLAGGDAWIASIQHEVQTRDVLLPVVTPEAWASEWVQKELQLAIATKRRILPVLLRNTQVDGFLLTTQWVTVIGEEPPVAARSIIMAIEAPTAPGRNAVPQVQTETLDDLITLCRSLIAERRYTEALSTTSRGLAIDPDSIEMLRLRGWVLLQINEPQKATEIWRRVLTLAHADQAVKLAQEMVDWLRAVLSPTSSLTESLAQCLAVLLSQLTSGAALYDVLEYIKRTVYSNWQESTIRPLISGVKDAGVLRAVVAVYKDRYPWSGTSLSLHTHTMFLVRLLCEGCYGYPPDKATSADVDGLRYYVHTLAVMSDPQNLNDPYKEQTAQRAREERAVVEQYLQRLARQQ